MIREALEYIVGLNKAQVIEITTRDGKMDKFSDKTLHRINPHIPMADNAITMHTLTSLVDYIKGEVDSMSDKMIIDIVSPTEIKLYSALNEERDREYIAIVKARVPSFPFNQFIGNEEFNINMQSKFIDTYDKDLVMKFAGTVENGTIEQYKDDGVTQKATIKTGLASKDEAIVPNPVTLKPYRTFLEVDQQTSDFIFRMRDNFGVECAIFEADGGAWMMEATKLIKEYLTKELEGYSRFTIIS